MHIPFRGAGSGKTNSNMRFFTPFCLAAIACMAASCSATKKAVQQTAPQVSAQPQNSAAAQPYADGLFDFGFAKSYNKGKAYQDALRNAQANIATRLYRVQSSVDTDFARDTENGAQMSSVSNRTARIVGVYDRKTVSVKLVADPKFTRDASGVYECEVQVVMDPALVRETAKALYSALPEDDALKVRFEEQQFVDTYEKELADYRASQNNR